MGTRHPSPPVQGVPWHPRQGMLRGMTAGTGCSDTLGSPKAPPPFLHTWVPPLCLSFPKRSQTPEPRSTFIDSKQRLAPVPQGDSSIPLGGGGAWGGQQCHPVPRRLLSSSCTRWQRARRRAGSSGLRAHTRRVTSSALSPCGTLSLAVPPRQHPRCPTAPHGSTVFPPPRTHPLHPRRASTHQAPAAPHGTRGCPNTPLHAAAPPPCSPGPPSLHPWVPSRGGGGGARVPDTGIPTWCTMTAVMRPSSPSYSRQKRRGPRVSVGEGGPGLASPPGPPAVPAPSGGGQCPPTPLHPGPPLGVRPPQPSHGPPPPHSHCSLR